MITKDHVSIVDLIKFQLWISLMEIVGRSEQSAMCSHVLAAGLLDQNGYIKLSQPLVLIRCKV